MDRHACATHRPYHHHHHHHHTHTTPHTTPHHTTHHTTHPLPLLSHTHLLLSSPSAPNQPTNHHHHHHTFSLCLCLGCCVSRVFNTSFFVAVSPCQEIGTSLSGKQCLATGAVATTMNSGTGQQAPSLLNMSTREAHWGVGLKRYRPVDFNWSGLPC